MICRSCGHIYFRKNKQNVCLNCYTNSKRKEKMFYTVKQWKRFSWDIQTKLSEQYEIFLTDHKTLKEKLKGVFKRSDSDKRKERREKLKRTFKKIVKGVGSKEGSNKMGKLARGIGSSSGSIRNFDMIIGHKQTVYESRKRKRKKHTVPLALEDNRNYNALLKRGTPKF